LTWPRTLAGRVALVMSAGLVLAHLLTFGSILFERGEFSRSMMSAYFGRDVATAVAVLDALPPDQREAWLPRLARANYHYRLKDAATDAALDGSAALKGGAASDGSALARQLAQTLRAELPAGRVGAARQAAAPAGAVLLPLTLADGQPLQLVLVPPSAWISTPTLVLLAVQLVLLLVAAAVGVRIAVRPLTRLAQAADGIGTGTFNLTGTLSGTLPSTADTAPLLPESGPQEVASAARAFNAMQQRIGQQLAERLQLLAAISHDLQTPITRLRLRTEQLADPALRDKVLADLQAMQSLVEEGLTYARTAQAAQEPLQAVDLNALLDGLVCDATDAGHEAHLVGRHDAPLITRVQALRRLLTNLLDNACKFAGAAELRVLPAPPGLQIAVLDRGPGIPAAELATVLLPFHRLESSRSRETGGTGLGLAIAQQLALALGGQLSLHNRDGGGLEARLSLPLPAAPAESAR